MRDAAIAETAGMTGHPDPGQNESRRFHVEPERMPTVSLDQQFVLSPDAVFRDLDGEGVVLDLKSGIYFGLNALGTRIWQLLQTYPDLRMVFRTLFDEYDVEAPVLERDLLDLVERLADAGLGETQ